MKLIINADDFGLTKSVNKAILNLSQFGTLSSTTVMINMPYADEVKKLLENEKISIGLHFNLTQGTPVSAPELIPNLVDKKGNFVGKNKLIQGIKKGNIGINEIYQELIAQYDKLHGLIGDRVDHIDSHQGLNKISAVRKALIEFSKMKKINAIRIYNKHYLVKDNNGKLKIKYPHIYSLKQFGLKRVLVELVLKMITTKIGRFYSHPDGLLLATSHKALDVFRSLSNIRYRDLDYPGTLEIPFHPSETIEGLQKTTLLNERVEEYNYLMTDEFKKALSRFELVNYSLKN